MHCQAKRNQHAFGVLLSELQTCDIVTGMETQIGHRSFSSFTSWMKCGKAWQLERQLQAPQIPAWYFIGGSAFHASVEQFLKEQYETD